MDGANPERGAVSSQAASATCASSAFAFPDSLSHPTTSPPLHVCGGPGTRPDGTGTLTHRVKRRRASSSTAQPLGDGCRGGLGRTLREETRGRRRWFYLAAAGWVGEMGGW